MKIRSIAALTITTMLTIGACGSDAPKALSESAFLDEMAAACTTVQEGIDKLTPPTDVNDTAKFAKSTGKLLTKLQDTLAGIVPPADFSKDLRKFKTVIGDEIAQFAAMEKAGKAADADGVTKASEKLDALSSKQRTIADDLGVDECAGTSAVSTATTLPAETLPPTTIAAITVPETVAPPLTLPITLPPAVTVAPVTLPPETLPPITLPPITAPPATGGGLTVGNLTDVFVGPAGLTLANTPADVSKPFVDIVAGVPALAAAISSIGVGVLNDSTGKSVATVVVAVASGGTMPPEWDQLLCNAGEATDLTTPNGIKGISCAGSAESGISQVFSLTENDLGFILATFDPAASAADLTDGFFAANGG